MQNILILLVCVFIIGLVQHVHADVFIPKDELTSYFDSNGIYTVVGAVKNTEPYPVLSSVHLTVSDGSKMMGVVQDMPTSFPGKDMPFKIKIPNMGLQAKISDSSVEYKKDLTALESKVTIIYDRFLTKHADGHLSGRIVNDGNQTEYDLKIYATIHGVDNSFIDVAKSVEKIEKIDPGQIIEFTMYPDPSVAPNVVYYSCFALGDETIIPLYAVRNGERFNFRYDSTASFVVKGFDETGTSLSLAGINSFKFPTYVNFEFPKMSDNEKFVVLVDGVKIQTLQSSDDDGNWHVAFDVPGSTQNEITIQGFSNPNYKAILDNDSDKESVTLTQSGLDYSFVYYVVPIIVLLIGVFVYVRKRSRHTI